MKNINKNNQKQILSVLTKSNKVSKTHSIIEEKIIHQLESEPDHYQVVKNRIDKYKSIFGIYDLLKL